MTDVLTPEQRQLNMSRIRGRDTKPELLLRRGLHARGRRYILHSPKLPGRPDMTFPSRRAILFVHGCFWHGHECHLFRWPTTNKSFWFEKIGGNIARDEQTRASLATSGWRVGVVWECALKGTKRAEIADLLDGIEQWLDGDEPWFKVPDQP